MELSDDMRQDLVEFQNLQQQLQLVMLQRQQLTMQLSEIDRVREELGKSQQDAKFFRSIGPVLVPKGKSDLETDLQEEKEILANRNSLMTKQEEKMKQRLMALQDKFRKLESGFSLGGGPGEGGEIKQSKGSRSGN